MKYSSKLLTTALALSGLLVASQAHAVPETFFFTGSNNWTTGDLKFTSQSGNATVTVGGFRGNGGRESIATSAGFGLVVCSGANPSGVANGGNCSPDQHYIDNRSPGAGNEHVKFTFASGVEATLLALQVAFWDSNDDFSLRVGNTNRGNNLDIGSGSGIVIHNISSLGGDLTDNMFSIGARGNDNNDDFKLRALRVDITTPPPPVSTPEPSTLLMLGSGLAGLGLWRMRKSNKA